MTTETLSDKICELHGIKAFYFKDAKDFIQKIKDRIDNPSGEVVCSVRMIHYIIDEEAGDALIHSPSMVQKDTPEGKSSLLDSSGTHSQQDVGQTTIPSSGLEGGDTVQIGNSGDSEPAGTHGSDNASCANCGKTKDQHFSILKYCGEAEFEDFQELEPQFKPIVPHKSFKHITDNKGCGKLIEHRIPTYDYRCGDVARDLCPVCSDIKGCTKSIGEIIYAICPKSKGCRKEVWVKGNKDGERVFSAEIARNENQKTQRDNSY